jgi:GT2 family glycosyltransferase
MADSDCTPRLVAFCTTCKGRVHHLRQTLPQNLADHAGDPYVKFVILDYGSQDDLLAWILSDERFEAAIQERRLIVASHPRIGPFQMAHAKNMAHRIALDERADLLVNLDADNFTGPYFASHIRRLFAENPHIFLWGCMIQPCKLHVDADPFIAHGEGECVLPRRHAGPCTTALYMLHQLYDENERPLTRGITGRIAVSRTAFLQTGGYDEKYANWGPDDQDMVARLKLLGYEGLPVPNRFLGCIHHGPKLRFKEYPHADPGDAAYYDPAPIERTTAVANFGQVGCGWIQEYLPGWEQFHSVINAMPTRIFGIGMHKTGTLSLAGALNLLGLDCEHWPTPRWARNVWEEMRDCGKSLTLERHYAATDFPIAMLFRELDQAYPGSKFILTVRDEVDWLRSVRNHWNPAINPWRKEWDSDCFTHRMHQIVYGSKAFDPLNFLKRYRGHNAAVLDYFKDRPGDLLVMDMDAGDPWRALCSFLGTPIPSTSYPRLNAL